VGLLRQQADRGVQRGETPCGVFSFAVERKGAGSGGGTPNGKGLLEVTDGSPKAVPGVGAREAQLN